MEIKTGKSEKKKMDTCNILLPKTKIVFKKLYSSVLNTKAFNNLINKISLKCYFSRKFSKII
jgi:hypothetical protein